MINEIKESDWKYLRKLKPILLERACAMINKEAEAILKNKENLSQLQLFKALYEHYHQKDDMIADCFDDHKRSKAKVKILNLFYYGILSESELQGFSENTREFVEYMMENRE